MTGGIIDEWRKLPAWLKESNKGAGTSEISRDV
jgi:hypothetical protein